MFDLTGRVALVTGAGQGIGAGIARALAGQGAHVAVNDLHADRAADTVKAITDAGHQAFDIAFDVTDYDAVVAGVAAIGERAGPVDVLVNNAGNGGAEQLQLTKFRETDPASWRGAIEVNIYGVLNCSRAVINAMCERGWGRVITVSSLAGLIGADVGVAAYGAGKGGGAAFTRHLAVENARSGVTANTVALGLMDNVPNLANSPAARAVPTGRLGSPEDVGAICVYLASDESAWMTGQTIPLNGGMTTG